jgi:hypothetical protein
MAWTNPKTWAISEVVTAAMLNTHIRDNLNWILPAPGAWIPYTATMTTTGTAQTAWVLQESKYFRSGNLVIAFIFFRVGASSVTGTGNYLFSLPVNSANDFYTGTARMLDQSSGNLFMAFSTYNAAGNISLITTTGGTVGGPSSPFTWFTNDDIQITHIYEAA